MLATMNRAIAAHKLKPMTDGRFAFEDARTLYRHVQGTGHFGKIVITLWRARGLKATGSRRPTA